MKDFIVYQQVLMNRGVIDNRTVLYWDIIIRKTKARSKEEAIGKFALVTNSIEAIEKLPIICGELSELKCIE